MDEEDNKKIFEVDNREIDLDDELPLLPIRNHGVRSRSRWSRISRVRVNPSS